MTLWLATTESGVKEHAADYMVSGEGAFPDDHEVEILATFCGIANPILYMEFWNPGSEHACKSCITIFENRRGGK